MRVRRARPRLAIQELLVAALAPLGRRQGCYVVFCEPEEAPFCTDGLRSDDEVWLRGS